MHWRDVNSMHVIESRTKGKKGVEFETDRKNHDIRDDVTLAQYVKARDC